MYDVIFNNILVISWLSVLLMEENFQFVISYWKLKLDIGIDCIGRWKSTYDMIAAP
jgi:hypothetical protein